LRFGNSLSFKIIWKYIICLVLLNIRADAFAIDTDKLYEQIEGKQFVGRLWLPDTSNKNPAILLIGGSGGGYENEDAKWLSSLGFVVLNIRYFGVELLPKKLVNIPIEYFNTAITWLDNHKLVKKGAIGLFGHSRGTEAAILTSYYNPLVKAVVVRSPSSVIWAGPGWSGLNESAWSWNSEPLEYHSVGLIDGAIWLSRILRHKKLIVTRDMFDKALDDKKAVDKARLPVEHIKANLLLLSGKDDQQWPSTKMSNMLVSILDESNFDFYYKHVAFDNAGHRPGHLSKPDDTFANGGTLQGNIDADAETKIIVKEFFDKYLR
jgi:pimeloyl-ACP methyl ester carboxylesterase